eukprot:1062498-Rhodomonas_salina.2
MSGTEIAYRGTSMSNDLASLTRLVTYVATRIMLRRAVLRCGHGIVPTREGKEEAQQGGGRGGKAAGT